MLSGKYFPLYLGEGSLHALVGDALELCEVFLARARGDQGWLQDIQPGQQGHVRQARPCAQEPDVLSKGVLVDADPGVGGHHVLRDGGGVHQRFGFKFDLALFPHK